MTVMMKGSNTGMSYLAVAMKDGVMLGIKPNVIGKGDTFGKPNLTYFGSKLRSAPAPGSKSPGQAALANTFVGIQWENQDSGRCSTQVGIFVRGTPDGDSATFLESVDNGALTEKLIKYLTGLIAETPGAIPMNTSEEMKEYFDAVYGNQLAKVKTYIEHNATVAKEIEPIVGVFANQGAALKKLQSASKLPTVHDHPAPLDIGDKPGDEQGHDDGDDEEDATD